MTQRIKIEELKTGMVIIKVTAQNGPVKIKKSGLVSSNDMVNALAEMGVQEVEIDPDMSVEIKKPKITKSKTQQLVEDTSTIKQNIDQGISEQFNRSLFLPSVQELPEAWQYYGKKALVVTLVIAGGFCVGLASANLSSLTQLLNKPADMAQVAISPKLQPEVKVTPAEPQAEPEPEPEQTNLAEDKVNTPVPESNNEVETPVVIEPKPSVVVDQTERLLAEQQAQKEELEEQEQNNIPPELLQKFRNALASIGDETPADPADKVQPIRDVPAVNELPAWILTELPSLAFSAHMYVSAPKERWVRVNGKRIVEGQEIEDGLVLLGIEPQHVIMTFKGQEFSMEALSDW